MSARIEYAPGEAWCVAAGRAVLVCERDLPAVRARALHDAAATVETPEALRHLLALEPTALLGIVDAGGTRALLRRHGVPATADDAPLPDRFGDDWVLDEPGAAVSIAAGDLPALLGDTLPLEGGVVRVAALRVAAVEADAVATPTVDAAVAGGVDETRTGAFGQTQPPRATATASAAAAPQSLPSPPAPAPAPTSAPTPAPEADADGPIGGLIDSVPGFIKPAADVSELAPGAHVTATRPGQALAAPASPPAAQPFVGQPTAAGASAEPVAADALGTGALGTGDHDGMTITAEQARRMQEERDRAARGAAPHSAPAEHGAPATGPLVLSTLCERGHVNAPGTLECAACGAPVDDGTAAQRRRPEVAVAALPSGERIPLGRGVVIGRRPRSRRVEDGRVPRLVTVESPSEDISRSHLELRVDDWNLIAVDLSSTNGTLLLREGAAPQRLRPEAATILQLGDRLDLGDGVVVTIEPAEQEAAG